jgi:hypothetical protein
MMPEYTPRDYEDVLADLIESGQLERSPDGFYTVTDLGKAIDDARKGESKGDA